MRVIWSTFSPNAGELASAITSSLTKASTLLSSLDFCSVLTGTRPAACSGAMTGTGSGGVRVNGVAVTVCVSVLMPALVLPQTPRAPAQAAVSTVLVI
jgi:hypothetical protein